MQRGVQMEKFGECDDIVGGAELPALLSSPTAAAKSGNIRPGKKI